MSISSVLAEVRAVLESGWTTTPICWPQEHFVQPRDGLGMPLPFVAYVPEEATVVREGVGPIYENDGYFSLAVLVPVMSGYAAADAMRVALKALLNNRGTTGGVIDVCGEVPDQGKDSDGNYNVSTVLFQFRQWGGV